MSAKIRRLDDCGNSAVEFALIAPTFLALVFSIFYVGWTALEINTVHFAMLDAARALQIKPSMTQTEVQTLVSSRVSGLTGGSGVTVTVTKAAVSGGAQLTTASATYPLQFSVPLIGSYTYNYNSTVTVVVYAS